MVKINAFTWYIDIRDSTYRQALFKNHVQRIEILILNIRKIYAYNKFERNEGIFDPAKEFEENSCICPSAASLVKFLVFCKSINTLKLILIEEKANLNKSTLESMISYFRKGRGAITIKYFKSDDKNNYEEAKDRISIKNEFVMNKASKDNYDELLQKSSENSKDEDLRHSDHPTYSKLNQPLLPKK